MQVNSAPGNPSAGVLPHGATIPVAQNASPVDSDELLSSLDADTRAWFTSLITELNQDRSAVLQSLVGAGNQVLSATAAQDTQLTATVNALPPFLAELRATLGTLNTTLGIAKPTLNTLRPVAPLHQAPSVLDAAVPALPSITRFSSAFKPGIDAILPAARELAPVISFVGLYSQELTAAMANLAADLEATAPAATTSGRASYLRAIAGVNDQSIFGQSVRDPDNRHNTYFSPGELANLSRGGLLSSLQQHRQQLAGADPGRKCALPSAAGVPVGQRDRDELLPPRDPFGAAEIVSGARPTARRFRRT